MKFASIILIILTFSVALFAQSTVTGVQEVYLARDDGEGNPGDAVTSFFTTDIPIYCVVQLDSSDPATVKMIFVAVSVPGVKADSKVVSASYTTRDGQDRVNFTGKPFSKWSAGKYRVDIFVNGTLATNVEFDIRPASGVVTGAASFKSKAPDKPKAPAKPRGTKPNQ